MDNLLLGYQLKNRIRDGVLVIEPEGNLLSGDDHKPLEQLLNYQMAAGINKVLFNLHDIKMMNSEGLGILLIALAKIRHRGGKMAVCNIPDPSRRLLEMTKLNLVITELSDEETGIAFLKSRTGIA